MNAGTPSVPTPVLARVDRERAELVRWCLGERFPIDEVRRRAVPKLLRQVVRRRRVSVLAHVHLVAAFRESSLLGPIESVLAVGCGAGVTELFLAATHPETVFTLADHDPSRLETARAAAEGLKIDNVRFRRIDLLEDPPDERFDLVSTVEVLEHIDDDHLAAHHLTALSARFVYTLVPFCSADELVDERLVAKVWQKSEHYRPGYTRESLQAVFPDLAPRWVRACYYRRTERVTDDERGLADAQIDEIASILMSRAVGDIRDLPVQERRGALGIEMLGEVGV